MSTCNEVSYNPKCLCNFGETRVVRDDEIICCGRINNDNLFEKETICREYGWTPSPYQTQLREHLMNISSTFRTRVRKLGYNYYRCDNYQGTALGLYKLNINDYTRLVCGPTSPALPPREIYGTLVGCYEDTVIFHSADHQGRGCHYDKWWNLFCYSNKMIRERPRDGLGGECGSLPIPDCGECPQGLFCDKGRCRLPLTEEEQKDVEVPDEEAPATIGGASAVLVWTGVGILGILLIILGLSIYL